MAPPSIDRNLLFGVIALQDDLIDPARFTDVCAGWAVRMDRPLADLLVERGWITSEDRLEVERKLERKLRKYRGDVRATLGAVAGADARDAIRGVEHPEIRKSLSGLPPAAGHVLVETLVPPHRQDSSRYALTRLHGEGGLGKVWLARDGDLNREVALKEIRPEQAVNPETWRRFLKEAQITGQLEHPNIVPVYELARRPADDQPFYVMRLVRGQTLRDAIAEFHRTRAKGPADRLELQKLLTAFVSVCQAVGYAHSRGVVHRDLKPENVVLGGFGEVIVLDWGLAKMIDQPEEGGGEPGTAPAISVSAEAEAGRTQGAVGTPAYMAPEQVEARHELVDGRTDVYALGGILFEILTGRPPAAGGSTEELFRRILAGALPRARELDPTAPRPLDAICAKALARDRAGRYAKATDLAEDVRRWVADEPVSAWREPWTTRARRWVGRHRTSVTAAGASTFVALVALGYFVYEARLRAAERRTAAIGRVDSLARAEVRSVPDIIRDLGDDRWLVRDRLEQMSRAGRAGLDGRRRLPAALALLPDDPSQVDFLIERLVDPESTPDEVLVIRDALISHRSGNRAGEQYRAALRGRDPNLSDSQLRAAGALARISPDDPLWTDLVDRLGQKLVHENPLYIGSWREVYQPIAPRLVDPLRRIYSDRSQSEPRDMAFTLLFEFATRPENQNQPEDLVALVGDADVGHFRRILSRLDTEANRGRAIAALLRGSQDPAFLDDDLTRQQARQALALLRLGQADRIWQLFRFREDPGLRTELIHLFSRFDFEAGPLITRLRAETDVSARRALVLCLGEFPSEAIPEAERQALPLSLRQWYQTAPDPGLRSAAGWLLRRWGRGAELSRIDADLARGRTAQDRRPIADGRAPSARPTDGGGDSPALDWYVNGQGQTYIVIRGPVEFRMGSTRRSDPDTREDEIQHLRRIERSYAIAARETTMVEWRRFLEANPELVVRWNERRARASEIADWAGHPQFQHDIPGEDCAIGQVTWYEAVRYCNWLSKQEGLAEDQWCYPKEIGPEMKLPADYLERTGYRLPTEAEWEYACRAGSVTARPFGGSSEWLPNYGWYQSNSGRTMHPVGLLKPNEFGLFDILGNAYEWCTDSYKGYVRSPITRATPDSRGPQTFSSEDRPCVRGGSWDATTPYLRSSYRNRDLPTGQFTDFGFRIARTR